MLMQIEIKNGKLQTMELGLNDDREIVPNVSSLTQYKYDTKTLPDVEECMVYAAVDDNSQQPTIAKLGDVITVTEIDDDNCIMSLDIKDQDYVNRTNRIISKVLANCLQFENEPVLQEVIAIQSKLAEIRTTLHKCFREVANVSDIHEKLKQSKLLEQQTKSFSEVLTLVASFFDRMPTDDEVRELYQWISNYNLDNSQIEVLKQIVNP